MVDVEAAADAIEQEPTARALPRAPGDDGPDNPAPPPPLRPRRATLREAFSEEGDGVEAPLRMFTTLRGRHMDASWARKGREGLAAARRFLHRLSPLGGGSETEMQQEKDKKAADSKYEVRLELLHRYNILSVRSRLLRLFEGEMELTDDATLETVSQELDRYCSSRFLFFFLFCSSSFFL